jgi:hypothetical protein
VEINDLREVRVARSGFLIPTTLAIFSNCQANAPGDFRFFILAVKFDPIFEGRCGCFLRTAARFYFFNGVTRRD